MNKKLAWVLLFCFTIPGSTGWGSTSWASSTDTSSVSKDVIELGRYNLRFKVPPTWASLAPGDPHSIAFLASSEQPSIKDTQYGIFLTALKDGLSLDELMDHAAKKKAYQMAQPNLIKLGTPEEVEVAGLKGREDMFLFSVNGFSFMYVVVGFEKKGMGYIFDFWSQRNMQSKMAFERFRGWLKNGVSFIDSEKDISEEVKLQMQKADKAASVGGSALVAAETNISSIRNIADFTQASYADQKQFMEKKLPENTDVLRLSKQAMLAEHSGHFKEAKGFYEQLLVQKDGVIVAQGEEVWAMLHCAVQRMSEVTGDAAREKAMLVWIRDNMLAPEGPYHQYLGGLLPPVQEHLKERLRKFDMGEAPAMTGQGGNQSPPSSMTAVTYGIPSRYARGKVPISRWEQQAFDEYQKKTKERAKVGMTTAERDSVNNAAAMEIAERYKMPPISVAYLVLKVAYGEVPPSEYVAPSKPRGK